MNTRLPWLVVALGGALGVAIAGPLDPPAGPVAPTYKTLNQVEPRTDVGMLQGDAGAVHVIDQPGSYFLSGNIDVGVSSPSAIEIRANDVTLDLNGFRISGSATACVRIKNGLFRVTVRNGTLTSFDTALDGSGASDVRVEAVNVLSGHHGIMVGAGSSVDDCSAATGNVSGDLISVGPDSLVTRCRTRTFVHPNSTVTSYLLGDTARAFECEADGGGVGFSLGTASSAAGCSASNTAIRGFSAGTNSSIMECSVQFSAFGIVMDTANRVERCKIGNVQVGIFGNTANTIVNTTINAAVANGGTAVSLSSARNRVEGNDFYAFGTGVSVQGGQNVVIHNVFQQIGIAASGGGVATSIVPIASNAAELASNPQANVWQ